MTDKVSNKELLSRSKEFLSAVIEGNNAHIENVKNSIEHHRHMLEMELLHLKLMHKLADVVNVLSQIAEDLEVKEQELTIH